jgi:hypothetical protein
MKDFLFITYSWHYSVKKFKNFEKMGHSIDIIDEKTIEHFNPKEKYKNVVVYLHDDDWSRTNHGTHIGSNLNRVLNSPFCIDSFLIQSDDTDWENVQTNWTYGRSPDLIMHREYTSKTINPYSCPIYPFHFGYPSIEDTSLEKDIDVFFVGHITNQRRMPFVQKILEVKEKLSHLNWYVNITGHHPWFEQTFGPRCPNFKEMANRSKVGLHYFGNSYDAMRIWELASCKTALIMPKLRQRVFESDYMGSFDNYFIMKDDASDLEERIIESFEGDKYREVSQKCYDDYTEKHSEQKVFDYYYNCVTNHCHL